MCLSQNLISLNIFIDDERTESDLLPKITMMNCDAALLMKGCTVQLN